MTSRRNKKRRFFLREALSPTFYNLSYFLQQRGWKPTRLQVLADFSESHFDFHEEAARTLEFKHLLADLVTETCPGVAPKTYGINDLNWTRVLNQMAQDLEQHYDKKDKLFWILKPALLNNGQHIRIFDSLQNLRRHFLSTKRLGGEHVVQQYVMDPHLLRDFRKYSIRQFILLTNYAGAFVYPYGYCNVSRYPFAKDDFTILDSHLTNEHLYGEEPNVIQIPFDRFEFYPRVYAEIKTILQAVISGLQGRFPDAFFCKKQPQMAIFGVDFMVDASGRVWLLEANHGACFPVSPDHPLQACFYQGFWQALIDEFVLPLVERGRAEAGIFERIG